jgi:hypothetical protein
MRRDERPELDGEEQQGKGSEAEKKDAQRNHMTYVYVCKTVRWRPT